MSRFDPPSETEVFYTRALSALAGPRRRTALALQALNAVYWLAVIAVVAWLGVQAFYRPLPISDRVAAVVTPLVRAGEPLKVDYLLTRRQSCAADVSWSETDGGHEVHRFGPNHVASGGKLNVPDHFVFGWKTAADAEPGPSRLRVVIEWQCPGNYLESIYPLVEVLPEIEYETLPRVARSTERATPGPMETP